MRSGWPTEARNDPDRKPPVGWKEFAGTHSRESPARMESSLEKTGMGIPGQLGLNYHTNTGKKVFTTSELSRETEEERKE